MNVAFLFNSDHPTLGQGYGLNVLERILATDVLQRVDRHMRVSVGDIRTYSVAASSDTPTTSALIRLCYAVYEPHSFDRLEATHGKATVYCWLFQNMNAEIAETLHTKLGPDPAYVGAMDVNFSNPTHLYFFRNSLLEAYRIRGPQCTFFHSMGSNEDPDIAIKDIFEKHGMHVGYEDIGARRTVFDKYATLDHFKRVNDFERVFGSFDGISGDLASDLTLSLEELHPKLFDAFAAAARTLERAETEEDLAQAALSGRRLLEKTADYLFPPQKNKWNGRKVGEAEYKNRLWAYIEKTLAGIEVADSSTLQTLGKEVDRLVDLFNAGLHADPTREKVEASFRDLVLWLAEVIELSPAAARRPYLAYEEELDAFSRRVAGITPESE